MTGDRIPLVDLGWQTAVINDHVQARWADLIGRSAFVLGDAVASFEAEYAHHTQVSHCIGVANGTDAIELLIRAAGIRLDRALFPLLVGIERFGPIGVVDLADRAGRDYTTVSRQVAKLESLGLDEDGAEATTGAVA